MRATCRAGHDPAFGRLANVPDPDNRRFYPRSGHNTIFVFDPKTNEREHPGPRLQSRRSDGRRSGGRERHRLSHAQRAVADPGDRRRRVAHRRRQARAGLRARLHRPRRLPAESAPAARRQPEATSSPTARSSTRTRPCCCRTSRRPSIRRSGPYRRQPRHARLQAVLRAEGQPGADTATPGAWQRIKDAALDVSDDGLHNGSAGVTFIQNHDVFKPFALEHVAQAYTLMMPGNTVVYFNGREFGDNRDFPKPGRGDALSVRRWQPAHAADRGAQHPWPRQLRRALGRHRRAVRLRAARRRRSCCSPIAATRASTAARSRNVGFAPGHAAGGAERQCRRSRASIPTAADRRDIPQVVRVFEEGGVSKVNVRFQRPGTIDPRRALRLSRQGLSRLWACRRRRPRGHRADQRRQGAAGTARSGHRSRERHAAPDRHQRHPADSVEVRLRTRPVRLLGSDALRDVWADGDQALLSWTPAAM